MNTVDKIFNAGADFDHLPNYLRKKVKATNIVTLILVFTIAVPFVIISLIFAPPLFYIPLAGGITGVGVIIVNTLGGLKYSRLFISILPVWQVMLYNSYLCGPDDQPIGSLYLVAISFMLAPFIMFDLREKVFLFGSLVVCSVAILSFPIQKVWFNVEYDPVLINEYISLLKTGWLSYVTTELAILSAVGTILGLAILNSEAERRSDSLRREAEEQKEQLHAEKLQREVDLERLTQAQQVERKQQWASEGITKLSYILRSKLDEKEIYDRIIAMTVKYLEGNQGGLYVVQGEKNTQGRTQIDLVACYAYGRKKYSEKTISEGEGLLGQTYLEGKPTYMTNIPEGYLKITSGLGESTPRALLIAPLKVNDVVEGLLEIASFKPFETHEIEFVNNLGEGIASFIQNDRVNKNTRVLLEQAQQQSEQLKAQEEEMRQNMEELAATQEEMQRKEREYQKRIQMLEERT
ncbi:gas vesicle protein [Catalinimonas alkaloidigena]|uniref:GAF domain-containing protein n=1 Tax=Catalinimonas alkaloidigena TaxID=1075417 RepID=UPI0024076B46|nr:GAF domain-containing protein [Catalinimonas alkaloidigena]MDF9798520.1 gas vesicle protein [Catalinimonas alkaloidigena]